MKSRAKLKEELTAIYRAAIAAVDPGVLVGRALEGAIAGSGLVADLIAHSRRTFVLAIGKGSYAMATELERRIGERMVRGLAIVPRGLEVATTSPRCRYLPSAHPVPDQSSVDAAAAALELLKEVRGGDLVVVALSGGASAMFVAPVEGIALDDKVATNAVLLRSGATIKELNCVRKHLSAVKGGNLLRSIPRDATAVTLILSDVPGDDLATIGSGLTVPDPTTFSDAIGIMKRRRIWGRTPERVRDHLEKGLAGEIPETAKSNDPIFEHVTNLLIGSNRTAVDAAAKEAERRGYTIAKWRDLAGEADDLGRDLAHYMAKIETAQVCVVAGGEPTVTVHGSGRGGRAQQCALAMLMELAQIAPDAKIAALVAGTDGIDGPTDAAGAFAFTDSAERAVVGGIEPAVALRRNDAYAVFDSIDDLLRIGPTGTNVTDLLIGLANY